MNSDTKLGTDLSIYSIPHTKQLLQLMAVPGFLPSPSHLMSCACSRS